MRCEVVAIGTELLLGQIVDTNSSWIGEQLALAGIDCHFQVKVGDNAGRIEFCIRQALERGDAVICCGGLGPTQDDITREVIAQVMGVPLERDEAIVAKIRAMFENRGRVMTDNNRRQADIPVGASAIAEMPGTAPGLNCPLGDKVIYAVPGVPSEMREMMLGTIIPDLRRRSGQTSIIRSLTLRSWGESESGLAERLAGRIEALDPVGNPTIAFLASGIEGLKVRLTAKADDEATVEALLAGEEANVRAILGDIIFGINDQTMEAVVVAALRERGIRTKVHTGGVSRSGSSRICGYDTLSWLKPDVAAHVSGGPIPMPDEDLDALVDHTEFALEICSSGNYRSAIRAVERLAKAGRLDRLTLGTDTPGGTGVLARGMLRNMIFLSSVVGLSAGEVIAVATGNTAKAHGLDTGVLKPGMPADLVIAGRIDGSAGTTLTEAIEHGDLPGISTVMIDGELVVSGRSEQTPPPQDRATVELAYGCPFCA